MLTVKKGKRRKRKIGKEKMFASPLRNDAGEKRKMFINNMAKKQCSKQKAPNKSVISSTSSQPGNVYKKQIIAIMTNYVQFFFSSSVLFPWSVTFCRARKTSFHGSLKAFKCVQVITVANKRKIGRFPSTTVQKRRLSSASLDAPLKLYQNRTGCRP